MFAVFYTATVTFPFVVSISYWFVLYPSDPMLVQGGEDEPLHNFILISTTVLNSVIAFVEVMILSSVREQKVFKCSLERNDSLRSLGYGLSGGLPHRYVPLVRDVDSLWLFCHRRICVQVF